VISIITCTMRPDYMEQVFSNYSRQNLEEKELIIILNRDDMDINLWKRKAKSYKNVHVFQLPQAYTLGRCMNEAINKANYNMIAKFDDDDYYAPSYLKESVEVLRKRKNTIVGKSASYIYFEEKQALMLFRSRYENQYRPLVKGGTLVFKKSLWEKVKFPDRKESSDSFFLKKARKKGYKIYSVSKFNYVCVRRKDLSTHTQKRDTDEYMSKCELVSYTDNYIPLITKKF
jgi:glycosyltransferase involved in cell wall biosynthesis